MDARFLGHVRDGYDNSSPIKVVPDNWVKIYAFDDTNLFPLATDSRDYNDLVSRARTNRCRPKY